MPINTPFAPRSVRWLPGLIAVAVLGVSVTGTQVVRTRDTATTLAAPPAGPVTPGEAAAEVTTPEPGTSTAASPAAAVPSAAGQPTPAATTPGRLAPVAVATPPVAAPVTAPTTGTPAQPAPTQAAARTQPGVGSYPATITGTAELNGEPQQVGPTGTLDVEQLTSSDQHQSTQGGPADLDLTLRYDASAARLVTLKLTAGGITKTVQPATPPQFMPFAAAKGTRWTWRATSTDGKTTIDAVGTVTGTDTLTIGGQKVPVTVVDYVMTPSGDVTGTVHLTSWVSSAYRLIVKQHQVIDAKATAYGFTVPFTCDTTTTLTRLDPA